MITLHEQPILRQTEGYNVSERYQVIPTMDVIQRFETYGFELQSVQAAGTRSMEKALKQSHMVRMSSELKMGGGLRPEVIIHNSYDGTKALNIRVGIFRFVCANGIVSGHNLQPNLQIMHSNTGWSDLINEFIDTYEEKHNMQKEWVAQLEDRQVSLDEAYEYASAAVGVRHIDKRISSDIVDPLELLLARRREDVGKSAWLTFNRVQEAMQNGLFNKYNNDGSMRKAKMITSIEETIRMNTQLSDLTSEWFT